MKKLAFLLCAPMWAQMFPFVGQIYNVAPRTVIAGSRTAIGLTPLKAFNFTINASTDVATVTTSGVTPVDGTIVELESSGTMPAGVSTTLNGAISAGDTTITLTSGSGIQSGDVLLLGGISGEAVICTTIVGNVCSSVARGQYGPPATSHSSGTSVLDVDTGMYGWPTAWVGSGGTNANAAVCSVSGSTFILRYSNSYTDPDPCTGRQIHVTSAGTGTLTAMWVDSGANLYLDADPTGWPAGTTFEYKAPVSTSECGTTAPTSGGKVYSPGGGSGSQLCIFATVPSGATTGTGTTHTTFCTATNSTGCATFDWAINVVAPQTTTYSPPSSFPSLTGKAYWEGVMTARPCPGSQCGSAGGAASTLSGPANFCDPLASPSPVNSLGAGTGSGVSYYGWNLLFDNMAIYTGNNVYRTGCFATGMSHAGTADLLGVYQYITGVLGPGCSPAGNCQGFAHFTESPFRGCRTLSNTNLCAAGLDMQNNYIVKSGAKPGLELFRENIYGLDDAVALHKYGNYDTPYWADIRDLVITLCLRATESDTSGQRFPQQVFMIGLATHALEADFQINSDPRTQYVQERLWDYGWAGYNQVTHIMRNFEGPNFSAWCNFPPTLFQPNGVDGGCGQNNANFQSLQDMVVNGPWWLWAMNGDTTRRDQADDWFNHALDQGGLTGKQASEVYYDTFNAVPWRLGTLSPLSWYGDATSATSGSRIKGKVRGGGKIVVH